MFLIEFAPCWPDSTTQLLHIYWCTQDESLCLQNIANILYCVQIWGLWRPSFAASVMNICIWSHLFHLPPHFSGPVTYHQQMFWGLFFLAVCQMATSLLWGSSSVWQRPGPPAYTTETGHITSLLLSEMFFLKVFVMHCSCSDVSRFFLGGGRCSHKCDCLICDRFHCLTFHFKLFQRF